MKTSTALISKTILINAPKETIWEILVDKDLSRQWYAAFMPGSYADTNWKLGSKATFKDDTESGLFGTVTSNKMYEELSVKYEGTVVKGKEDRNSRESKLCAGMSETYRLKDEGDATSLMIEQSVPATDREEFLSMWEQALENIKNIAEKMQTA